MAALSLHPSASGGDANATLLCILYCEFDPHKGPRPVFQVRCSPGGIIHARFMPRATKKVRRHAVFVHTKPLLSAPPANATFVHSKAVAPTAKLWHRQLMRG